MNFEILDHLEKTGPLGQPLGVVWQDTKHAALYCDKIMPCAEYGAVPDDLKIDYNLLQQNYRQLASEYFGPEATEWDSFVATIHESIETYTDQTAWMADDTVIAAAAALAWTGVDCFTFTSRGHDFEGDDRLLQPEYYEDRRIWWMDQGRSLGELEPPLLPPPVTSDFVEVQLVDMEVINTDRASWEQVYEFKRDPNARGSLRDMRLLFDDKLCDRSVEYIRDYVQSRLEAYERTREKHGFDVKLGTMQLILNSKSAAGAAAIAAAGIVADKPLVWTGAATIGAILELANATLTIAGRRKSLNFWSREAELSYIFLAKNALER